jgi:hypothetical protein
MSRTISVTIHRGRGFEEVIVPVDNISRIESGSHSAPTSRGTPAVVVTKDGQRIETHDSVGRVQARIEGDSKNSW